MTTSIILLEGPDLAGKTTLSTQLGADTVLRSGPPPRDTIWEREYIARLFMAPLGNNVVLDRWHLGELVYPEIVGRKPIITPTQCAHVSNVIDASCGVFISVLLLPGADVLAERFAARGDQLFGLDEILAARDAYAHIDHMFDWVCETDADVQKLRTHLVSLL